MSSAQASSSLAADAPRYGNDPLVGAYYARNTGTGVPVVTQLVAGAGVTLSPAGGQGVVTVTSTAQGVSALNPGNNTGATTLGSSDSTVVITAPTAGNINFSVPSAITNAFQLATTPLSGATTTVIQALTGLVVGQTYNYVLFFKVTNSTTVANALSPPANSYLNLLISNASFPGATGSTATSTVTIPLVPLLAVLTVGGTSQTNFFWTTVSGQFTATQTTANLSVVPGSGTGTSGPYFTDGSIVLAGGSANNTHFNITPVQFRTS